MFSHRSISCHSLIQRDTSTVRSTRTHTVCRFKNYSFSIRTYYRYSNVAFENFGIAGKGGAQLYRFQLNESKTGFVDNVTEVVDFVVVRPCIDCVGSVYFSEMKSFGLDWTYFGFDDIDQVVPLNAGTIRQWTRGIVDAGKGRKERNIVGGFSVILKKNAKDKRGGVEERTGGGDEGEDNNNNNNNVENTTYVVFEPARTTSIIFMFQ